MSDELSMNQKVTTITVVFLIAVILLAIKFCTDAGNIINAGLFIATTSLVAVAYSQLDALTKQTNAGFLLTFNREFFDKPQNQAIIAVIDGKKPLLGDKEGEFTEYQVDDYLGYFELMSLFEKKSAIDFDSLYEMFGHYITGAWDNSEINNYIGTVRKTNEDNTYYDQFEALARRVKIEDKRRQERYKHA